MDHIRILRGSGKAGAAGFHERQGDRRSECGLDCPRAHKIVSVVARTVGIEGRPAIQTVVGCIQVLSDGKNRLARAAQDRGCMKSIRGPLPRRVVHRFLVTCVAGIKHIAARESDGNDVLPAMVVPTTGVWPHVHATERDLESIVRIRCHGGAPGPPAIRFGVIFVGHGNTRAYLIAKHHCHGEPPTVQSLPSLRLKE